MNGTDPIHPDSVPRHLTRFHDITRPLLMGVYAGIETEEVDVV